MADQREQVKDYYSNITTKQDGKMETSICCCAPGASSKSFSETLEMLPQEIVDHFYGCGSPIPEAVEGLTILDLGCGTGRDVYMLSCLVGEKGHVIGVDMNDDQLAIATKYQDEVAKTFGYASSNVTFKKGYIEDLNSLDITDESIDIVISNCVINLSPDKEQVFKEIWRVLKVGGELYFSDIFADRRLPKEISDNEMLVGECLGGALYKRDFKRIMRGVGFVEVREVQSAPAAINNKEIEEIIGDIQFTSDTVRAFKLPDELEDDCENYGQKAIYTGGIKDHEESFSLDGKHTFTKDEEKDVCGNTASILEHSRFAPYFKVIGDKSVHLGACKCSHAHKAKPAQSNNSCCC